MDEINAITWTVVDSHFTNTFTYRLNVSCITRHKTFNSDEDAGLSLDVTQIIKPFGKPFCFANLNHGHIVATRLQVVNQSSERMHCLDPVCPQITRKIVNRRDFLKYSFRGFVAATLGKGFYNSTDAQIELVRVPVTVRNLPASLRGLKIGLLTDLHASAIVSAETIRTAGRLLMAENPDLIVMTGDYISGSTRFLSGSIGEFKPEHLSQYVDALANLKAPLGIYGVLGNHDFWSGPESVRAICEAFTRRIGMVWLRNRSVELQKGGSSFHLLGVDDYWEESCSLAGACKGLGGDSVRILLSHNPDINDDIALSRQRIDLVLSGHTHGGQVVMPFLGQPVMPSKFGQKYRVGLVRDGDRQTYISRGVGCLLAPIRLNCPPEVTVLTLI